MSCIVNKINEKVRYMKHIAILKQPFFNMVLNGEKTIESRWSMHKVAPYNKVSVGDEIDSLLWLVSLEYKNLSEYLTLSDATNKFKNDLQ